MLVLTRRAGESIVIGDSIKVTVSKIRGGKVVLAIDAPREVPVMRDELVNGAAPALAVPMVTGSAAG